MLYEDEKEKGYYKLRGEEYTAFLTIIATHNALTKYSGILQERLKTRKNAWRDLRCAITMLNKVYGQILETIPTRKLLGIQSEMKHISVVTKMSPCNDFCEPWIAIPEDSLKLLLTEVTKQNCWCCELQGRKAKQCKLRKIIDDTIPYDLEPIKSDNDLCELAGVCDPFEKVEEKKK